jgi:WD40 repeat protein
MRGPRGRTRRSTFGAALLALAVTAAVACRAGADGKDDLPKLESVGGPVAVPDGSSERSGLLKTIVFAPAGDAVLIHWFPQRSVLADAATGKEILKRLPGPQALGVDLDPQSLRIVGYSLRDVNELAAAFDPTGKTIIGVDPLGRVLRWDAATGKPIGKPLGGPTVAQMRARPEAFAIPAAQGVVSADGKLVALPWQEPPVMVGQKVTRPGKSGVLITDAAKPGQGVRVGTGEDALVAFSPDGKRLLLAGPGNGAVQYDTATGKTVGPVMKLPEGSDLPLRGVNYSPDGKTLLILDGRYRAQLFDAATGEARGQPFGLGDDDWATGYQGVVHFSPDSAHVRRANYSLLVVETATGKVVKEMKWDGKGLPLKGHAIGVSADGKWAVVGTEKEGFFVCDGATGQAVARAPLPAGHYPYLAVFSPDGRTLAVATDGNNLLTDRVVRFWRLPKEVK